MYFGIIVSEEIKDTTKIYAYGRSYKKKHKPTTP